MKEVRDAITQQQLQRSQQIYDSIEKARIDELEKGKKEMVGAVKEWGGKKFKKMAEGKWVPVNDSAGGSKDDEGKGKQPAKKDDQSADKAPEDPSTQLKGKHYKDMNKEELHIIASKYNVSHHEELGVKQLREAVADEIINRNIKEGLAKMRANKKDTDDKSSKAKSKLQDYVQRQKDAYDLDSQGASFLRKKAQGLVQGIKHEITEWKTAGTGVRKFMNGQQLTDEEKKAIRTVAIHTGIVVALAAAGGAAGSSAATAAATMGKKIGLGYLEHAGIMRAGHAMLFAKSESNDDSDAEIEAHLQQFIEEFADYLEDK